MHPVYHCIRNFFVGKMPPPREYIRCVKYAIRETLFRFIKRRHPDRQACLGQALSQCSVNAVRIDCHYVWVCSLMTKLVPNSDLYHRKFITPFVLRLQGENDFSHPRREDSATTATSETRLIACSISHACEENK